MAEEISPPEPEPAPGVESELEAAAAPGDTSEPWLQAEHDSDPGLRHENEAAAEPVAPAPEPEPAVLAVEPEPIAASAQVTRPPEPAQDVKATMVRWPGSTSPGNGSQAAQPEGFDEATSIIPAWQHSESTADSRRTVSLQAMPPEEISSGAGFAALLTFETGPFAGRIVALPSQMVTVGRAPDNDVVVGDPATSGHHGRIELRNGFFWVSDLGSTNGTLVNGEPVIEKQLHARRHDRDRPEHDALHGRGLELHLAASSVNSAAASFSLVVNSSTSGTMPGSAVSPK